MHRFKTFFDIKLPSNHFVYRLIFIVIFTIDAPNTNWD